MNELRVEEFSELTSLIFAAAIDPSKWTDFLDHLSVVSGNVSTHLFGHDLKAGINLGTMYAGYDPDFEDSFTNHFGAQNAWIEGFFKAEVGQAVLSEWMCPKEKLVKTEFYNDWVLPQQDLIGGGGVIIVKEASRMLVLGGNIRKRDIEVLEKPWMKLVSLLTPHLNQAFEINRTLAGKSLEIVAFENASNQQNAAVFVVDTEFQLRFSNNYAQSLFQSGNLVRTDARNRISFSDSNATTHLERAIKLCSQFGTRPSVCINITCPITQKIFDCRIIEINAEKLEHVSFGDIDFAQTTGGLVTISEQESDFDFKSRAKDRYKLTNSEVEVVLSIGTGQTPLEISEKREVSIHTIRNQLKSAMSKMEARRQSDIVRILGDIG